MHPGDNVRRLRKDRGWKQEDLAKHSGVRTNTISKLESRRTRGSAPIIAKLAATLGVRNEEIVGGDKEPPQPEDATLRLRRLMEGVVLRSKIVRSAEVPPFSVELDRCSQLLQLIATARDTIATEVRQRHNRARIAPDCLDSGLLSTINEIAESFEQKADEWTTNAPYYASRCKHEEAKLRSVLGLAERTLMNSVNDTPGEAERRQAAVVHLDEARSCFEVSQLLKARANANDPALVLPTELKLAELQLERMLVNKKQHAAEEFEGPLGEVDQIREAYRTSGDPAIRAHGQTNCAYVRAKGLFCQATALPPREWGDAAWREWVKECERLSEEVAGAKEAAGDACGTFWALALAARCAGIGLRHEPNDEAANGRARMRYERALRVSDRSERHTLRSLLILMWTLDDLHFAPLSEQLWARQLLERQHAD